MSTYFYLINVLVSASLFGNTMSFPFLHPALLFPPRLAPGANDALPTSTHFQPTPITDTTELVANKTVTSIAKRPSVSPPGK